MIKVCKRCNKDMELPEKSLKKYCQKGTECYTKRMSEIVMRSVKNRATKVVEPDQEVTDARVEQTLHET